MVWAQKERVRIIESIKDRFIEASKKDMGLNKERLIADICMTHGSTRRKAQEYINDLKMWRFIEEDDMGLWLCKEFVVKPEVKKEVLDEFTKIISNA